MSRWSIDCMLAGWLMWAKELPWYDRPSPPASDSLSPRPESLLSSCSVNAEHDMRHCHDICKHRCQLMTVYSHCPGEDHMLDDQEPQEQTGYTASNHNEAVVEMIWSLRFPKQLSLPSKC